MDVARSAPHLRKGSTWNRFSAAWQLAWRCSSPGPARRPSPASCCSTPNPMSSRSIHPRRSASATASRHVCQRPSRCMSSSISWTRTAPSSSRTTICRRRPRRSGTATSRTSAPWRYRRPRRPGTTGSPSACTTARPACAARWAPRPTRTARSRATWRRCARARSATWPASCTSRPSPSSSCRSPAMAMTSPPSWRAHCAAPRPARCCVCRWAPAASAPSAA